MAVVTRPVLSLTCPGRSVEKSSVIVEEKTTTACIYHKPSLAILLDIYEKGDLAAENYGEKIEKLAKLITCEKESQKVFQTFCAMSFLDRYQKRPVVADILKKLDSKITNPHLTMINQLEEECFQLLTRMGTIENLNSLDTDLICLCVHCQRNFENPSLDNLLLMIGRCVWPYINRSLWESEPFVNFVSDILEVVGGKLEHLYPKNFKIAWDIIRRSIVGISTTLSNYSRLRLLSVVEHQQNGWSFPDDTKGVYREHYKQFLEARKKELSSFLGYLPSRRKTSLTVKPGRSAADFLKRRLSSDCQEKDIAEQTESSSSSCSYDSSDGLSDVFEEVFETDDSKPNCTLDGKSNSCAVKPDSNSWFKQSSTAADEPISIKELQNKTITNDKTVSVEESSFKDTAEVEIFVAEDGLLENASQDDATSSETSSSDADRRSLFIEKKKIVVKVPKKYVGRVIGARGTVIMYIQDTSGAKVNFIKAPSRPSYSMSSIKTMVHNTLGVPKTHASKEIDSNSNEEKKDEVTEPLGDTEKEKEEEEFEIIGTDETIGRAKRQIESIIQSAQNMENRPRLVRSYSEVTPVQGFKQIYRSLSCPITDWGESCSGDCASCQKGCYCRAFLLSRSESASAWVRPKDLAIDRDVDWTEFVVKTQVNDSLRRPSQDTTKTNSDVDHVSSSPHEADTC